MGFEQQMARESKIWGSTRLVYEAPALAVHELWISKGGYSSWHAHQLKSNYFLCLSGSVRVERREAKVGDEGVLEHGLLLLEGDSTIVPPGIVHRFVAEEPCHLLEIYEAKLDHADIVRFGQGGLAEGKPA